MIFLGHILDTLRRRHWRRQWLMWWRVRLHPVPVLRTASMEQFREVCRLLGLPPDRVFGEGGLVEKMPEPPLAIASVLLDGLVENAGAYDLRRMPDDRRLTMLSFLLFEFLTDAGARLQAPQTQWY